MDRWFELDAHLGIDAGDDCWSDEGVAHAVELVGRLAEADWRALGAVWARRPARWQRRLACVADRGDPDHAVPLLVDMIGSDDGELSVTAADALREFARRARPIDLPPASLARLGRLAEGSQVNKLVVKDLLKHVRARA